MNKIKNNALKKTDFLFKGKGFYNFWEMILCMFFIVSSVHAILLFKSFDAYIIILLFVGAPFLYWITAREFFLFYLYNDFILIRYPFKIKSRRERILLKDIKHLEYRNKNGRGGPRGIVIIYPRNGITFGATRLYFDDWYDKSVFLFLRIMYSKGFEIDITNCIRQEEVLSKIKYRGK
jgi:hypothetical protein